MSTTELNPRFFYESSDFPFLRKWQDAWSQILLEWQQARHLGTHHSFDHYTQKNLPDSKWVLQTLLFFQMKNKALLAQFPSIAELLKDEDLIAVEFSLLTGGTHILPHKGFSKMILRCHLPLIVPEEGECALRVGEEQKAWNEGELLIFDDSFEHEAWNKSTMPRLVLMLDFPNPTYGFSAEEICRYKLENLSDQTLLSVAPKETWIKAFEARVLPSDLDY
jgi:ornithine lipid ester-linked acyl 2-hydroxylase